MTRQEEFENLLSQVGGSEKYKFIYRKGARDGMKWADEHPDKVALLKTIDRDRLAKGVLRSVATTIIQFLDANLAKGNMCLSNMECEDLENAVRNADWMRVYNYMKKKLEEHQKVDRNMLDKACEWLQRSTILADTTIERFKKAMEQ